MLEEVLSGLSIGNVATCSGLQFPLRMKETVCNSYVGPEILQWSAVWCLRDNEMGILR